MRDSANIVNSQREQKTPLSRLVQKPIKAYAIFYCYIFFIPAIDKSQKRVYYIRDLRITLNFADKKRKRKYDL